MLDDTFHVYDTTLRDGAQQEGLNLSVADKLVIARQLDELGVGFIEGGWPGAIPKDTEFFRRARTELRLAHAHPRPVAVGDSTISRSAAVTSSTPVSSWIHSASVLQCSGMYATMLTASEAAKAGEVREGAPGRGGSCRHECLHHDGGRLRIRSPPARELEATVPALEGAEEREGTRHGTAADAGCPERLDREGSVVRVRADAGGDRRGSARARH